MKTTFVRETVLPALQRAASAAEGRTLPILGHILFNADDERVTVTGSDLQTQITIAAEVRASEPGSIAAPARKFADLIRMLPSGAVVDLESKADRLTVKSGRSRYTLACLPADNYPEFEAVTSEVSARLQSGELLRALVRTQFAAATNDVRHFLNGIVMMDDQGKLAFAASDGHRLAYSRTGADLAPYSGIVPLRAVEQMIGVLKAHNGEVDLYGGTRTVQLRAGPVCLSVKLIEGRYPDWRRMVEIGPDFNFLLPRAAALDALRRVVTLSEDKYLGVAIDFEETSAHIALRNSIDEEAAESIDIPMIEGETRRLGFNARYILDALGASESDHLMCAVDSRGGVIMEEPGKDDWLTLTMPMKI